MMRIFSLLYKTIIDALFPLSAAEQKLLTLTPEQAHRSLTRAPKTPVEGTYSIFAYKDEIASKLVWNIKYKKSPHAIGIGGYALFQKLQELDLPENTLIIPMPITHRRRKERGYNQCELLTDEINRLDTSKRFNIHTNILIRTHHSSRQTLKGRQDRLEDAKGIFAVDEKALDQLQQKLMEENSTDKHSLLESPHVVVIDDVITTGSTITEAMETLKNTGFKNVIGLSIAH